MNREQAIRKHADAVHNPQLCYYNEQLIESEQFVKGLKALGLIKFEEEKKETEEKNLDVVMIPIGMIQIQNSLIIKHLREQGYTVTKNG